MRLLAAVQRVEMSRHRDVGGGEAAGRVGRQRQRHPVPLDQDVRMMVGLLSHVGDRPGEEHRVTKVLEFHRAVDAVAGARPVGQPGQSRCDLLFSEQIHAATLLLPAGHGGGPATDPGSLAAPGRARPGPAATSLGSSPLMMTRDEAQSADGQPRPTPLHAVHERLGATMTDFAGWLMPLRYGSETAEHRAVRGAAGLFDLSHMGEIAVSGPGAAAALDYALVGHLSALQPGRARYTMICAPDGGVLDDLIAYRLADNEFLVVANAANTPVVAAALRERATGFQADVDDLTDDYALIAIQGPHASRILQPLADIGLDQVRYYAGQRAVVAGRKVLLARTGYTGEDGFELFTSPGDAEPVWMALAEAGEADGLVPAGLAARDTLRLEAGMPLYGNELTTQVTPFDVGLWRVVVLDKPGDFV